eukprot:scaffold17853_cov65-Cyclotella_meneghiniana.AAC.7
MGFKLEHFLEQPRLHLILLHYQFNVFSTVQHKVSADIPLQFSSEIFENSVKDLNLVTTTMTMLQE